MFSVLASSTTRSVHLDLWGGHYPLSLRVVHLDGPCPTYGVGLQEVGDPQGHLSHSTSWLPTSR